MIFIVSGEFIKIAHNNLAVLHLDGWGVTKSYKEARRLFGLALAKGYGPATQNLKVLDDLIRTECPLLGKRIIITGTSREDLNGKVGVATDFDHAKGRYVVAWGGRGNTSRVLKVLPENLESEESARMVEETLNDLD